MTTAAEYADALQSLVDRIDAAPQGYAAELSRARSLCANLEYGGADAALIKAKGPNVEQEIIAEICDLAPAGAAAAILDLRSERDQLRAQLAKAVEALRGLLADAKLLVSTYSPEERVYRVACLAGSATHAHAILAEIDAAPEAIESHRKAIDGAIEPGKVVCWCGHTPAEHGGARECIRCSCGRFTGSGVRP